MFFCAGLPITQSQAQISLETGRAKQTLTVEAAVLHQDMWLIQGDIFVGRSAPDSTSNAAADRYDGIAAAVDTRGFGLSTIGSLWENAVIDYEFDESLTAYQISRLNVAIDHWNVNTQISLRQRPAATAVNPLSSDFLVFKAGPGCASWVGRQGGAQTVWISDDCGSGSIVHEIGHALGLLHEHARFDRDNHIEVLLPNVEVGKLANFARVSDAVRLLGEYDYDSIMHYGSHFFSGTGAPTLLPRNGVAADRIGQRISLSQGDIAAINEMYSSDARLDLQSLYAADQDITRVQLDVTLASIQGTHDLRLELHTHGALAYFDSNEAWLCEQSSDLITCSLSQLNGFSSSRVWLDIAGEHDFDLLNSGLASGTQDSNPGNNGKPLPFASAGLTPIAALPLAAAALNDAGGSTQQGGSGGGSQGPLLFVLILALQLLKSVCVNRKRVFAPA